MLGGWTAGGRRAECLQLSTRPIPIVVQTVLSILSGAAAPLVFVPCRGSTGASTRSSRVCQMGAASSKTSRMAGYLMPFVEFLFFLRRQCSYFPSSSRPKELLCQNCSPASSSVSLFALLRRSEVRPVSPRGPSPTKT